MVKYTDLYKQGFDYIYWGFEERKTSHGDENNLMGDRTHNSNID